MKGLNVSPTGVQMFFLHSVKIYVADAAASLLVCWYDEAEVSVTDASVCPSAGSIEFSREIEAADQQMYNASVPVASASAEHVLHPCITKHQHPSQTKGSLTA
ncbi:hypothetical protein Nepgr_023657 [Nepenthes gracilis]|uniref:Uncharacterized protein n=1 Tax=Nepenthes gracilis TaxID=150966 RepID=A0AAD3T3G4_NEPGR|nr:hypothetical protein Nepgr_023657 [Nepenthes gracilis]